MKHYFNEGKQYIKKDNFEYQGRSDKQYRNSATGAGVGIIGIVLILGYLLIINL